MATIGESDWDDRIEADESLRRDLSLLFKNLRSIAVSNMEYFQDATGQNQSRFYGSFHLLHEHIDRGIEPGVEYLLRLAHLYDIDPKTPANGYRSVVMVIHKCCLHILTLTRYITINKESFLFRGTHYGKELEAFVTTLGQLRAISYYLQKLVSYCGEGELFPDEDKLSSSEYSEAESLMMEVEALSQETFYGRCLAFQFCDSMVKPLTTINLVQASYSEGWDQNSSVMRLASSVVGSRKYVLDPEMRAQQVVNVTRNGDVKFCKAFWSIAESDFMHNLPLFVCPPVQINKVISIDPEVFDLPLTDGSDMAKITPPCAHTGPGPVMTRLLSADYRQGQEWLIKDSKKNTTKMAPMSPGLVIHCHGGGFVAQSSASHQVYLRTWCQETGVPFFCVDYSLAPEAPFPRQLEEVFYAYCWAIKNCHRLGSTGERVCIVGDSAGGNLAVSVAMRAASYGIRVPDGVVSVYGCMLVKYTPSPSRVMSLMDPLLPIGIVSKCLAAYAGMSSTSVFGFPPTDSDNTPTTANLGSPVLQKTALPKEAGYKCHKPTGSGDSGFHDDLCEEAVIVTQPESGKVDAVAQDMARLEVTDSHTLDINAQSGARDTTSNTSQGKDSTVSNLVNKIKEGAEEIDHEEGSGSPHSSAQSSPRKSKLTLEIGNFFRRRKASESIMIKSPSTPVFHSPHKVPPTPSSSIFGAAPTYAKIRHYAQSPIQHFKHMPIVKNPYMSPFLATDEQLSGLPPVHMIGCHLDPMLDDTVDFAKRLKKLNKEYHIELLEELPHGFLNFVLVSSDAKHGSDVCIKHLNEVLEPEHSSTEAFFSIDNLEDDENWEVINAEAASVH